MCGIAGIIARKIKDKASMVDAVKKMMVAQIARGPDAEGFVEINDNIVFGHRRLKIIDLSEKANQPMSDAARKIWIVYNGEIYNFKKLRDELKYLNYEFRSNSDTEVIIAGYEKWGIEKLLEKMRGMFAFALCDVRDKYQSVIYFVRDRLGIKPIYYHISPGMVMFASQVNALKAQDLVKLSDIDISSIIGFLIFGSVPNNRTYLSNIVEVPPAHYVEIKLSDDDIKIDRRRYWKIPASEDVQNIDSLAKTMVVKNVSSLFEEAVDIHLISDVGIGVFLSGGLDSSSITAIAATSLSNPVTTINIVFDEKSYDESYYAKAVADKFKTNHMEVKIDGRQFIKEIPNILRAVDQPSNNGVNTYFISKAARESGLTVLLSGLGGDELFLGYPYYLQLYKHAQWIKIAGKMPRFLLKCLDKPLPVLRNVWRRLNYLRDGKITSIYQIVRGMFSPNEIMNLLNLSEKEFNLSLKEIIDEIEDKGYDDIYKLIDYINELDFNLYMACQLLRDSDAMGMAHSIEIRVPFLDHILVEYMRSLPISIKLNEHVNKNILVEMMRDKLPQEVLLRKKRGFIFPFDVWLKQEISGFCEYLYDYNVGNKKYLEFIIKEFTKGRLHWSKLWSCLILNAFLRNKT